jgi:predicted Zn-dependent protease
MSSRTAFDLLADALCAGLPTGEELFLRLTGEDSDFARFSRARIRQAGHVSQRRLGLVLVVGARQAESWIDLGGDGADDLRRAREALDGLRALLPLLPEDPWLAWHRGDDRHERCDPCLLPEAPTTVAGLLAAADGLDLVGVWASGAIHAGFASSHGQRAWHTVHAWSCDWSCHRGDGQAIKGVRAGTAWDDAAWAATMAQVCRDLPRFDQPRRVVQPGMYRAWLEPAAVADLVGILSWGGFSAKARRTRTSSLMRLDAGTVRLSPLVTLVEDAAGLAPLVTSQGYRRPDRVVLVDAGANGSPLVSPRSAKEYGLAVNAGAEYPTSLRMAPGALPQAEALRRLGTGLWIGNVHYLNYSDRSACRITGMTRFACWWVENGEPVAPIEHLRFDDDIYGLFGDRLEALSSERTLVPDTGTYEGRSLSTCEVPGALVAGMRFTL